MKQEFNCSCINRHSLMQKNDVVMQLTKAHLKAEQSIKLILTVMKIATYISERQNYTQY